MGDRLPAVVTYSAVTLRVTRSPGHETSMVGLSAKVGLSLVIAGPSRKRVQVLSLTWFGLG